MAHSEFLSNSIQQRLLRLRLRLLMFKTTAHRITGMYNTAFNTLNVQDRRKLSVYVSHILNVNFHFQ